MTHFTVGIIVPSHELSNLQTFIADQMAPYDENTKVEPYVSYSAHHAQADFTREIRLCERIIDPKAANYNLEKCQELPETLRPPTPDEKYLEYVKYHEHFNGKP